MADAAGPIIRQVLVKLQIRALQRQHQRARNASDYDAALQRAALYTPRIVLQNSEQLNSLLLEDLTAAEIGCLIDAANSLVGVWDADKFCSPDEFEQFSRDEGYDAVAKHARRIWGLGFESCAAMSRVISADMGAFDKLLNLNPEVPEDYKTKKRRAELHAFVRTYQGMDDLKTVLGRILPAPNQAIIPASSTQTLDRHRKTHPSTLQEWSTFPEEVLNHKANKKPTQPRFVSSQRSYRGAAKENTVSGIFDTQISRPINSGILHWKRENWLEPEDKEFAIWEAQGSNVPTNAEVEARLRGASQYEDVEAAAEAVSTAPAQAAASLQVQRTSIYDQLLKEQKGLSRGRSLAELKRVERLLMEGWRASAWNEQEPPNLVDLWNHPERYSHCKSLVQNAIGVIEQWNYYASTNGIHFGLIFTHIWMWALKADGRNNLFISPAFRYDAVIPTVLEVVDFITHKALSREGLGAQWTTLNEHLPRSAVAARGGGSTTTMARGSSSAQQPPPGGAGQGPSELGADPPGTPQSVLALNPFGPATSESKEAIQLAQVAATVDLDWIRGVVGRGALGAVFKARMPCGRSVALKLAPARGDEADMLRNEAHAYLALQDLWGKDVPELLLAGPLVTFGSGYALGTALLPGRPLQQGDADLLPAALAILANIHTRGVIHGDLRPENFLVNEADIGKGGAKTVVIFDFSHSSFDMGSEAQGKECDEMKVLFESL